MTQTEREIADGIARQKSYILRGIDKMTAEEIGEQLKRAKRAYRKQVLTADADQLITYCRWKAWCAVVKERGIAVDLNDLTISADGR